MRGFFVGLIATVALLFFAPSAQAIGYHTGSNVWAWGDDSNGQLGNGVVTSSTQFPQPVAVKVPNGVRFHSACVGDGYDVAVDTSGDAWAWGVGEGLEGVAGIGADHSSPVPLPIRMPGSTRFTAVACSKNFVAALDRSGRVWFWGDNPPPGATASASGAPVQFASTLHFAELVVGDEFVLGLDRHGQAWAWGHDRPGFVDEADQPSPVRVPAPAGVRFVQIAATGAAALGLDSTGRVWSWGDGDVLGVLSPDGVLQDTVAPVAVALPTVLRFTAVYAVGDSGLAITTTGDMWSWGGGGDSPYGYAKNTLGLSPPTRIPTPSGVRFAAAVGVGNVSATVALDTTGRMWAWQTQAGGTAIGAGRALPTAPTVLPGQAKVTALFSNGNTPSVLALKAAPLEFETRVSTLATKLSLPSAAFRPLRSVIISGAIAAGGALLITFPAEVFNQTLDQNYAEIREWWRVRLRWLARRRRHSQPPRPRRGIVAFVAVVLIGALLGCLNDPGFGINGTSIITYVAVVLAIVAGAAVPAGVAAWYHRRQHGSAPALLHALPGGLAMAAGCVLVSRLIGFEPGYLYGVVCGVVFTRQLARNQQGHIVAISTLATLSVSAVAWLAWVPVNHYAMRSGAFSGLVLVDDLLASMFISGLVGTVLGLLPLRFLAGGRLKAWHRGVWAGLFVLALFALVQIMLLPHGGKTARAPLATIIVLFIVFAVGSLAFRDHFEQKQRLRNGETEPGWRIRARQLLRPARRRAPVA